ncbi:MAG: hypothetical protein H7263_01360, partial [Candidatus Sericytochromatia bacterium]|nr:hypothetical protein [Candidatus Sericytochromatia bacterium]
IFISSIFLILRNKKNVPNGYYVSLLCLIYAPVRFYFDSLRATDLSGADIRYLGLTPGQYSSIGIFIAASLLAYRIFIKEKPKNLLQKNT